MRSTVPAWIRARPIGAFLIVCFVPVWAYELVGILLFDLPVTPWMMITPFIGPALGAFAVRGAECGRAGVRSLVSDTFRARVPLRWYGLTCLGLPALLLVCALPVPGLREYAGFEPGELVPWASMFLLVLVVGGPLGEEPGWRCFAHWRLQARFGPVRGALLLGLVWGLWHAPLYLIEGYNHSAGGLRGILLPYAAFLVFTVAISVPFAWLANRTRSGRVAILAHTFLNCSLLPVFFPGGAESVHYLLVQDAVFVGVAVLLVASTRGRLGQPSSTRTPLRVGR